MPDRIFYSWQSDLPNATNRSFIERALEDAAASIRSDESLQVEPVVDRDTAGVPGSPDIAATIFAKIDAAAVFVCDVSVINATGARPTPNPNVLIELGYAKKALGPDRVLMVMNREFGAPELLPFDLRLRRVLPYSARESETDRGDERRRLQRGLEIALRAIFEGGNAPGEVVRPAPISGQLTGAIDRGTPDQAPLGRRYMSSFDEALATTHPEYSGSVETFDEALIAALPKTLPMLAEFSQIADAIAAMDASEAAQGMWDGFSLVLNRYDLPRGFAGGYNRTDFDYYKLLGHEVLVSLLAPLVRERRWETIARLLDQGFYINRHPETGAPAIVGFQYASQYVELLEMRDRRLNTGRVLLHSDLLRERHSPPVGNGTAPWEEFLDADFLLYLRSVLRPETKPDRRAWWIPWSVVQLGNHIPRFLAETVRKRTAEQLLPVLGVPTVEVLRTRLIERVQLIRSVFEGKNAFFRVLGDFRTENVGTQ